MKCTLVLFLAAWLAPGADFSTGQAARAIIGQTHFTRQQPGASATLVGGVSGLAYANDMLFVVDSNRVGADPLNDRVLIFRGLSQMVPKPTDELVYDRRCPVCVGEASVVLGQPDFNKPAVPGARDYGLSDKRLRTPTSVATDGRVLAVADTDNNRVLIWNRIPDANGAPADVVVGQRDFASNRFDPGGGNRSMRGPQGVWIQNGKLFVADTQNHRILIYNSIPSANGATADLVLGWPNFDVSANPDLTQQRVEPKATNLLNPVSVTSDGARLFVADLGHNRVLVWNRIPASNQAPADLALGQPDLVSAVNNNSTKLCAAIGKDDEGKDVFPKSCNATMDFPRYALSDGRRLFIADGGNDRVLIYSILPERSGQPADVVIGQLGGDINQASDAADSLRTPLSLAWDGANLYVSDAFNRRITVYSTAERNVLYTGVRNAASREIFAVGSVTLAGEVKETDEITLKIGLDGVGEKEYKYKIVKDDTFAKVVTALASAVNAGAGDPLVLATANPVLQALILTSRRAGSDGNQIEITATPSTSAVITATTSGATLSGGQDAAQIAPGTIVSILGDKLSETTASAPANAVELPTELAGVQVYFDGIRAPLFYVSPTQINAQIPFELLDTSSINAFVRTRRSDGSVTVTSPVAATIVPQNPGIFAEEGSDPRPGVVVHFSSNATGTVSVDGSVKAGDTATVNIQDRPYSYTVKEGDTLASVRDALIALIREDPEVDASAAGVFTRIRLRARAAGPDGNGVPYSVKVNDGAQVILTPTGSALCCANRAGSRVTEENPAVPGETLIVYATGLGLTERLEGVATGRQFDGDPSAPREFVSSLAGGKTANVLFAGLRPGSIGLYELHLELNSDIPTNPQTQLTIAQFTFVSNIITFPVVNPNPPAQ
ncbi:MAG: hypothetical protein FJW37_02675 [Acidobacteria bacterium]|nr:hypothetical protein [Acidobacteriota bacterium]